MNLRLFTLVVSGFVLGTVFGVVTASYWTDPASYRQCIDRYVSYTKTQVAAAAGLKYCKDKFPQIVDPGAQN